MKISGSHDVVGTITGIVDGEYLIDGRRNVCEGDVIIGLPSNGLHTNGFSLIRKILDNFSARNCLELKKTLLTPTKIYTKIAQNTEILQIAKGFAHITGGGIVDAFKFVTKKRTLTQ